MQKTEAEIRESKYASELRKILVERKIPTYLERVKDRKNKKIERMVM